MLDQKDHIVAETAARIFADLADPQTINREKNGAWKESLWQTLDDAKMPLAWVPERLGGSGASLAEGFAILGVAGRFALAASCGNAGFRLVAGECRHRSATRSDDSRPCPAA